jgi:hypothetical protein
MLILLYEWNGKTFLCVWLMQHRDFGSIMTVDSNPCWEVRGGYVVLSEHHLCWFVTRLFLLMKSDCKRLRRCVQARLDDLALHVKSLVATEGAATQFFVGSTNQRVDGFVKQKSARQTGKHVPRARKLSGPINAAIKC